VEPAPPAILSLSSDSLSFEAVIGRDDPASQTVDVSHSGQGTLTWTATAPAPWVTLTPSGGTGPGSVAVGVNASGLGMGTYATTITVTAAGASNSPSKVGVTLTVKPDDYDGLWAGKTAQDSTVWFQVENNTISTVHFGYSASGPGCDYAGSVNLPLRPPIVVSTGSFSIDVLWARFDGTLAGESAGGTLNMRVSSAPSLGQPPCIGTLATTWTATKGSATPGAPAHGGPALDEVGARTGLPAPAGPRR